MKRLAAIFLIGIALLLVASLVVAQIGEFDLARFRIAGGGGVSEDGRFSLSGTIGQSEAGALMEGGSFELSGGYWGGASGVTEEHAIYLPLLKAR